MKEVRIDFRIPILMYHEVTEPNKVKAVCRKTHRSMVVTQQQFDTQMHWLAEAGFSTVSLYDIITLLQNKNSVKLPEKPIVITFDDGYSGNYQYALPILKEYGLGAIFFIVVSEIGSPFMMTWQQLESLVASGMSVQSHTMTHPLLGTMNQKDVIYELQESKKVLQNRLNIAIDFLSLPYGSYNNRYQEVAANIGYCGGCSSKIGVINQFSDRFFLNRAAVDSKFSLNYFKQLAEGNQQLYNEIALKNKLKEKIKTIVGEKFYNKVYNFVYGIESY